MNYKSFNLGDWIGHISGAIEDERELDGNEMRDLVEFLTTLEQEPILDKVRAEIEVTCKDCEYWNKKTEYCEHWIGRTEDVYYTVHTGAVFYCKDAKVRNIR